MSEEEVYGRLLTPKHYDCDCMQHYRSSRDSGPSGLANLGIQDKEVGKSFQTRQGRGELDFEGGLVYYS
jgi:hypothetical protein